MSYDCFMLLKLGVVEVCTFSALLVNDEIIGNSFKHSVTVSGPIHPEITVKYGAVGFIFFSSGIGLRTEVRRLMAIQWIWWPLLGLLHRCSVPIILLKFSSHSNTLGDLLWYCLIVTAFVSVMSSNEFDNMDFRIKCDTH